MDDQPVLLQLFGHVRIKPPIPRYYFDVSDDDDLTPDDTQHHNMTPEQYRRHWGLPPDYPMAAPNYSTARARIAKQIGLGKEGQKRTKSRQKPG